MKTIRILWWLTLAVSLTILIASLPGYYAIGATAEPSTELGIWLRLGAWLGIVFSLGAAGLSIGLACLLFLKRRDDTMGLFLSFFLLLYGAILCGPIERFLGDSLPSLIYLGLLLQNTLFAVFGLILFLIFPNGHFLPRWTRVLVPIAVVLLLLTLTFDYAETVKLNTFRAQTLNGILYSIFFFAIGIQVYRYRKWYTPLERQQTKWVAYGTLLWLAFLVLDGIPYYYLQNQPPGALPPWWAPLGGTFWWLTLMLLPISLTTAILRSRLFDIDIIIRRTLIYSILTAILGAIYFGVVILLQQLFRALTNAGGELAIIISTLAIAALFNPLRRRVQDTIDHRFYRRKYDAQKVLERFAITARDEVELEKLTGELLKVIDETMQPTSTSLWLKKMDGQAARWRMEG